MESRRWDGDERGAGVASGEPFAPGVAALQAHLVADDWVAEDPHAHLLPHIERACAASGSLAVVEAEALDDGVFEVTLDWHRGDDTPPLRDVIFGVVGSFAESSTHVLQRVVRDTVEYDVVTGMLPDQTHFRTHGHLVRFKIVGEPAPYG